MNKNPKFIFVGPDPSNKNISHPGGQFTMAKDLGDYINSQGIYWEVIDTYQSSFPLPPVIKRFKKGCTRIFKLIYLLSTQKINAVIIFSGSGLSFYERSIMAGICRLYYTQCVLFMLSGFFVNFIENSKVSRLSAKYLLKLPNYIGVQGDSWRKIYHALDIPDQKIMTIRNWTSHEFLSNGKPIELKKNDIIRFCFLGWLVKEKGVVELFEAVLMLSKQFSFEMIFIGGGTLEHDLSKKIKEANLNDRVKITGFVDRDEVKKHLLHSHIFILPSKAEGFPLSLLEAFSLGLPAICTNVGAISDSLFHGKNGYLLENGSALSIANAMTHYLLNPELIKSHSLEALNVVKQCHDRDKNCKLLFEQLI